MTTQCFFHLLYFFSFLPAVVLSEHIFHARIEEELPIGQFVVSLQPDARQPLLGRFVLLPGSDQRFFAFRPPLSSNLTVLRRIDFEQFDAATRRAGVATLQVRVGLITDDDTTTDFGLVEIDVLDINDNAPQFSKSQFDVTFTEVIDGPGTLRQIGMASDEDSPENGIDPLSAYSIVSGNELGLFRLALFPSPDGNGQQMLFLELVAAELNREDTAVHRLQIAAHDKGSPTRGGYAIVVVSVVDTNDNAPSCADRFINVTAQEPVSPPGRIQVSDADEGRNGRIRRYSLSPLSGTIGPRWPVVVVDEKSGQLSLPKSAGFGCRDSCGDNVNSSKFTCCYYQVSVVDDGEIPLSGTCRLTVFVQYTNAHAPSVSIRPKSGHVSVTRSMTTKNSTAHLSLLVVTDADKGPGGLVTAGIACGGGKRTDDDICNNFFLSEKTARPGFAVYSLKLKENAKWPSKDVEKYHLTIRANDSAVPPRSTFLNLTVDYHDDRWTGNAGDTSAMSQLSILGVLARSSGTSTDSKNQSPRFPPAAYYISVAEDVPVGTPIFQPNFAKKVETNVSNCRFSARYATESLPWRRVFDVHRFTGTVISRLPLDHETLPRSEFNLTVNCSSTVVSTVSVYVKITDVNDNKPTFNSSRFIINTAKPTHSFLITATDSDSGLNGTLTYWLRNVSTPGGNITVQASTGLVTISGLDTSPLSDFSICARDGGGLMSCSEVTVKFTKDEATSLLRFSQTTYAFTLPLFGTGFIGCVKASSSIAATISYKISSSKAAAFFMHSHSGCLFLGGKAESVRLSFNVEASMTSSAVRATSQVVIFERELTPPLNVTVPLSALPVNLLAFATHDEANFNLFLSTAKFTPAVSVPEISVNPHGLISISSIARQRRYYYYYYPSLIILATNETAFQKIIIQISNEHQSSEDENKKEKDAVFAAPLRLQIDRSTPLFACLHRLAPSDRCRLTLSPASSSSVAAGIEDLISVHSPTNCLSLTKMKPLTADTATTAVIAPYETQRFDLICKSPPDSTMRKRQILVNFTESKNYVNFLNQNSILLLNNSNNEDDEKTMKDSNVYRLKFPVLPVQGNSWAISASGAVYLLPPPVIVTGKQPSLAAPSTVAVTDLWLADGPQLGLISRPLGLVVSWQQRDEKRYKQQQQQQQDACLFRVREVTSPGQSIGRLRNHLPRHRGRHDRFQLLRDALGAQFIAIDWTAPFGDDVILLSTPTHLERNNLTLAFRRLADNSVVSCLLSFPDSVITPILPVENPFDKWSVLVLDRFLPPRTAVFDLNTLDQGKLYSTPSSSSTTTTATTNGKYNHQQTPVLKIHHEIDSISRSIRLTVGNYDSQQIKAIDSVMVFSLQTSTNFSIGVSTRESGLELGNSRFHNQRQQQQQTSVSITFRPSNKRQLSEFQLVAAVDEMQNLAGLSRASIKINNNNNNNNDSHSNNNNNNNAGLGITTVCSLAVNDLESHQMLASGSRIFRPAFLRRPNFGESVVFTLAGQQHHSYADYTLRNNNNNNNRNSLFKINNSTGEVFLTGFAEKEIESFEVSAVRLEDGLKSSLSCHVKFASFSPTSASTSRFGSGLYLPVYRFAVDTEQHKSSILTFTIKPRRSSSAATTEYRLVDVKHSAVDAVIDRKTGVVLVSLDKEKVSSYQTSIQFSLFIDIAKRNLLTGKMIPVELKRDVVIIIRFGRIESSRSKKPAQFPRSRLFVVPTIASIPFVLPVDFSLFSYLAEKNPMFQTSLRSHDGCLRIDWATDRIMLLKYFHNPPVTTCQLETDSNIYKLTFMKSEGWTDSLKLLNSTSLPAGNSPIILSESLPTSTVVARLRPLLPETTSIYLVDIEPSDAIGRFYITETGELLLQDELDFDSGDVSFTIRVAAVQLHPMFAVEFANLTLHVKNEDDVPPSCRLSRYFIRTSVPSTTSFEESSSYQLIDDRSTASRRPKKIHVMDLSTLVTDTDTPLSQLSFRLVTDETTRSRRQKVDNIEFSADNDGNLYAVFTNTYLPADWSYDVTFEATSPNGMATKCSVTILIDNIFDLTSVQPCSSDLLLFRANENADPGAVVGKVNCGLPSLLQIIPNNSVAFPFLLSPSGHLILTDYVDFERQPVYYAELISYLDRNSQTKHQQVTVQIVDCNDQDPIVGQNEYSFSALENSPRGTRIGRVTAIDGDFGISSPISFTLAAISPAFDCFSIDSQTGLIYTTCDQLDREAIGESFFATVVVRDLDLETGECGWKSRSAIVHVKIHIEDVNDNPPTAVFADKTIIGSGQFYLMEDRGPGYRIGWFRVSDPDRIGSDKISVELLSHNDTFAAVSDSDEDSGLEWLVLRKHVDFETTVQYFVPILLEDEGGLSTTISVIVNVLDANEHAPHFSQKLFSFVYTDTLLLPPGQQQQHRPIGQVWAQDGDGSSSEKLEFYLLESDPKSAFFTIDKWSGELFVNRQFGHAVDLIFADGFSINLTAKVFDRAGNCDEATLMITKETRNGGLAYGQKLNFSAIYLTIAETNLSSFGRPLTIFNAFDYIDKQVTLSKNLAVHLSEGSSNDLEGFFSVDTKTGDVSLQRSIDYESLKPRDRVIDLEISYADDITGVLELPLLGVKVTILDVNDNAPVVDGAPFSRLIINDNATPGTIIWLTKASDADSGQNSNLSFVLLPGENMADGFFDFTLDDETGWLTVARTLDRGRRSTYEFVIEVSDAGTPFSLTTQLTLEIQVVSAIPSPDRAVSGLEMASSLFEFFLQSNPQIDSIVGAVTALAGDAFSMAVPRFSLTESDALLFSIGPSSGIIRTRQMLYIFGRSKFSFTVQVGTAGRPPSSSATVIVHLSDSVLPRPGLVFDRREQVVELRELSPIGTLVANLSQSVRSDHNDIEFSIAGGNFEFSFNIDPDAGIIRVARRLDYESNNVYNLLIKATVKSHDAAMAYATVDVIVTDDDDGLPVFILPNTNPAILRLQRSDFAKAGLSIVTAVACNPDNGRGRFSYLINNPSQLPLAINHESGEVRTTAPVLDAKITEAKFTIQATINSSPDKIITVTPKKSPPLEVRVIIEDDTFRRTPSNLHAPVFTRQHSAVVRSSSPIGWPVLKASASDPDGDSSPLTFAVEDPDDRFPFVVDKNKGVLRVSRHITATGDVYVPVVVSDGRHRTRTNVHVEIVDDAKATEADSSGVEFDRDTYTIDVDDNWPAERPFLRVYAVSTVDASQRIAYSIPHPSADHLIAVNASTGELSLKSNRRLPFGGGALSFKVRAACVSVLSKSCYDDATIVVRLRRPVSQQLRLRDVPIDVSVPEDAELGTVVVNLTTDPLPHQKVRFFLRQDGDGYFKLENASIILVKKLDYEDVSRRLFKLKIDASVATSGYASLPLSYTMTVSVVDVNDCPPVFDIPIIHAQLNKTTSIFVTRLIAEDADASPAFKVINYKMSPTSASQSSSAAVDLESGTFRFDVNNLGKDDALTKNGKLFFDIVAFNPDMPLLRSVMTVAVSVSTNQLSRGPSWNEMDTIEVLLPNDIKSPLTLPPSYYSEAKGYFAILNSTYGQPLPFAINHRNGSIVPKSDELIKMPEDDKTTAFHDFQVVYVPHEVMSFHQTQRPQVVRVRVRRDPDVMPVAKCEHDAYKASVSDMLWTYGLGEGGVFEVVQIKAQHQSPRRHRTFTVFFELTSENPAAKNAFRIDKSGVVTAKVGDASAAQLPQNATLTIVPRIAQLPLSPTLNCSVVVKISRDSLHFRDLLIGLQRTVTFANLLHFKRHVRQEYAGKFDVDSDCLAKKTICRATLVHLQTGISREVALNLLINVAAINSPKLDLTRQSPACPSLGVGLHFSKNNYGSSLMVTSGTFVDYKTDFDMAGQPLELRVQFAVPGRYDDNERAVLEVTLSHSVVMIMSTTRRSIAARLIVPGMADDQVLAITLDTIVEKMNDQVADVIVTISQSYWSVELANCRSDTMECWYWAPLALPSQLALSRVVRLVVGSSLGQRRTAALAGYERFVGCIERVLINNELDLFLLEASSKSGLVVWTRDCACKNRTAKLATVAHPTMTGWPKRRPPPVETTFEGDWMPLAIGVACSTLLVLALCIGCILLRHRVLSTAICLRVLKKRHCRKDYRQRTGSASPTNSSSGDFALHNHRMISSSASAFAMSGMQVVIGSSNGIVTISGPSPPNSCGDSGFVDSARVANNNNNNKANSNCHVVMAAREQQQQQQQSTTAFMTSPTMMTPTDESASHSPGDAASSRDRESSHLPTQQLQMWALKRSSLGSRSASCQRRNKRKPKPAPSGGSPPAISRPTGYPYDISPSNGNHPHTMVSRSTSSHQRWQVSEWEYVPAASTHSLNKKKASPVTKRLNKSAHEALYATAAIATSSTLNRALSQRGKPSSSSSQSHRHRQSKQVPVAGGATVSKAMGERARRTAPIASEDQNLWQALLAATDPPTQASYDGSTTSGQTRTDRSLARSNNKSALSSRQTRVNSSNQQNQRESSFSFGAPGVYL